MGQIHSKFGNISYAIAMAIMSSFKPKSSAKRGGFVLKKCPFHKESDHVESSYSEQQRQLVNTTTTYLNALAKGDIFGRTTDNSATMPPRLADRIITYFLAGKITFKEAVNRSIVDLLADFVQIYPQLSPSLKAIFSNAGAEGIEIISGLIELNLWHAINKELHAQNIDTFESSRLHHSRFISMPRIFGRSYEVWCAAENVAKTIIRESREAAIALVRDYKISDDRHLGEQETYKAKRIRSYVNGLCEKVRKDQMR